MPQTIKEVAGEKYNNLIIIKSLKSRKTKSGKYEKRVIAKCKCGTEKEFSYKDLKRDKTKSCGCLKKNGEDFIGKIYGDLIVTKELKPIKGSRKVSCLCKCGNNKPYYVSQIRLGDTKHCGCKTPKKEIIPIYRDSVPVSTEEEQWKPIPNYENFLLSTKGRCFSIKSAVYLKPNSKIVKSGYRIHKQDKNKKRSVFRFLTSEMMYKLFITDYDICKYNLHFIDEDVTNNSLDNLFIAPKLANGSDWLVKLGKAMNMNAKKRNTKSRQKSEISKSYLIDLYKQNNGLSYYFKIPMDVSMECPITSISVDRINNELGYVEGNIALCTRFENMGRGAVEHNEFVEFSKNFKFLK